MSVRIEVVPSNALLTPQRGRGFLRDFDFSLNPYSGCAFQCGGCYVPALLYGRDERLGGWGNYVEVRERSVELLRRQAHRLAGATWFMSPVSDVYQPAERKHRLTRRVLETLLEVPFEWGLISTRSPFILDDLDLLRALGDRVEVGISIPTDREGLRKALDPKNPSVGRRLEACRALKEAGVPARIHAAPLQPHSSHFPRLAGEAADWVWIDFPQHGHRVEPVYRAAGIIEAMSPAWVEQSASIWRDELGPERVGFGQADFSRRYRSSCNAALLVESE